MPIPLGILAAAGFRPTAGGSYELIETITVGSGGAASVTFSNLNTYSSTYQHLQIRAVTAAGSPARYGVQMNGQTTLGNYANHFLYGTGSTVASGAFTTANAYAITTGVGHSTGVGSCVIDLLDVYETGKNKTVRSLTGNTGANLIVLYSGVFLSTNAISSIRLGGTEGNESTNFTQGSRFSLYGLKASA